MAGPKCWTSTLRTMTLWPSAGRRLLPSRRLACITFGSSSAMMSFLPPPCAARLPGKTPQVILKATRLCNQFGALRAGHIQLPYAFSAATHCCGSKAAGAGRSIPCLVWSLKEASSMRQTAWTWPCKVQDGQNALCAQRICFPHCARDAFLACRV